LRWCSTRSRADGARSWRARGRYGSRRRRPRRYAELTTQHFHACRELVDSTGQPRDRRGQTVEAAAECVGLTLDVRRLIAEPPIDLRAHTVGLRLELACARLQRGDVGPDLHEIVLGGGAGHLGGGGAATEEERDGEDPEPPPRHRVSSTQRGLIRK